jgi:hypothetical protein
MSVPVIRDGTVSGVIQVTRKGESLTVAGNDFTEIELQALARIAESIAPFI